MRKILIIETMYIVPAIIFCALLQRLNKQLLTMNTESSFALLRYNDYQPLWYFAIAVLLAAVGAGLVFYFSQQIRCADLDFSAVIAALAAIAICVIAVVSIIILINNPILRAVIVAMTVCVGFISSKS